MKNFNNRYKYVGAAMFRVVNALESRFTSEEESSLRFVAEKLQDSLQLACLREASSLHITCNDLIQKHCDRIADKVGVDSSVIMDSVNVEAQKIRKEHLMFRLRKWGLPPAILVAFLACPSETFIFFLLKTVALIAFCWSVSWSREAGDFKP